MSAFLQLRDAVVAALLQAPALAGGRVRKGRRVPVPAEHETAVDVRLRASTGRQLSLDASPYLQWETTVDIDLYVRATADADGETAVDALLTDAYQRIATTALPPSVASWQLEPELAWQIAEHDTTLVHVPLVLRVSHFTGGNALAAA